MQKIILMGCLKRQDETLKISPSAEKMADPQNPGFKSEKSLRCTVSH